MISSTSDVICLHTIDFFSPFNPNAPHTHTHIQAVTISLDHQQTSQHQPSAFWGLNSAQATTTNFLSDNSLGRTGLWNPIKKLTSSLALAEILISLWPCGFLILETAGKTRSEGNGWIQDVMVNRSGPRNEEESLGTFPEFIKNPCSHKNVKILFAMWWHVPTDLTFS